MKLGVIQATRTTYAFGLRHFLGFLPLCVVAGLPGYAHSLLPCPEWQSKIAAYGAEVLLSCFVVAVMASTLNRGRRGETGTVLPGIADAFQRLPTILGVSIVWAVVVISFAVFGNYLATVHPQAPFVTLVTYFFLVAIFCMAVPCAAIEGGGVVGCFKRSAALSAGSRLRILASYLLTMIPTVLVWGAMVLCGSELQVDGLWETFSLLVLPALTIFPFAFPAVIYAIQAW